MPISRTRSPHPTTFAAYLIAGPSSALTGFVNPHDRSGHVFYQSADGHIQEISAKPGSNALHTDLSTSATNSAHPGGKAQLAETGSALMSFAWPEENSGHVFYVGTDHHVHELYRGTAAWSYSDLSAIPRTPQAPSPKAVSPLTGFTWHDTKNPPTQTEHVFYLGTDDHVHELKQPKGAAFKDAWRHTDLSAAASATGMLPKAGSPLTSFAWPEETSEHVFYVATVSGQDHVIELYRVGTGTAAWQHNDLTAIRTPHAPSPRAGSPLTGFTRQEGQTKMEYVFYIGTDNNVDELRNQKGALPATAWQHAGVAGSAKADSALTSFVWSHDQSGHVFYVATNGHVHEGFKGTGGWHQADLTAVASATATGMLPKAGSPLTGFAWHDDTQDVLYLTTDGHLHELYYLTPASGWQHGDVSASVV